MNLILVILLTPLAFAVGERLQFTYQPMEDAATVCSHKKIRDLPDYHVECITPYETKLFSAHVVVRENVRKINTGMEVLYWVTAPGDTPTSPHKFNSSSLLLNVSGKSNLEDLSFSQGVENDRAYLTLKWKRPEDEAGASAARKERRR
jgi:hypothetical protein